MTDAAHNQHSDTAARAIATAPGPAVPARPPEALRSDDVGVGCTAEPMGKR